METTLLIARIIGPIYLVTGLALIMNRSLVIEAARDIERSAGLRLISALLALSVGVIIVSVHNIWTGWAVLITLFGWIGILKGVTRMLFPDAFANFTAKIIENPTSMNALVAISVLIGVAFTYLGYISSTT